LEFGAFYAYFLERRSCHGAFIPYINACCISRTLTHFAIISIAYSQTSDMRCAVDVATNCTVITAQEFTPAQMAEVWKVFYWISFSFGW
jgi:hypothetical protein